MIHKTINEKHWLEAVTHILIEAHKSPDDSVVDIANEVLLDLGYQADWDDGDGTVKITQYKGEGDEEWE